MSKVIFAFGWVEAIKQVSDLSPRGFDGAFVGFAEQGLELGEDHLDRVEVWAAGRQEQQVCAGVADQLAGGRAFVAAEVVGDDDVAWGERRGEALADPGGEGVAIDRPVQNEGRDDPVVAQPGQEGECLPVSVRDMGDEPLAAQAPATGPGHVGLDPGFIDKDQSPGIKPGLMHPPACPEPRHLRAHLLGCHQRFF